VTTDHRPSAPSRLPDGIQVIGFDNSEQQVAVVSRIADIAFAHTPALEDNERVRLEAGRGLLAVDDGQIVASNLVYSLSTSAPGTGATDAPATGEVPTAGISFVVVLPSHRRRGITSELMRRVLADLHERRAEPVASLWASEAGIYGRFGFGVAAGSARIELPKRVGLVRAELADPLVARIVEPADSVAAVESLAARVRSVRPGMAARPPHWQAAEVADDPADRDGDGPLRCVLLHAGDRVRAAARYRTRSAGGGSHDTTVVVVEMYSDGSGSHAAMWRWLTELDLVSRVVGERRPVDDPVLDQLTDSRAAQVRIRDGLWVRLVDVDRALAARGYTGDVTAVLELRDRMCPWNAGRWRLVIEAGSAQLSRTEDAPDIGLDTAELAAAYLGSAGALARLGRAGRITVHTPGVLDRLSRSFESAVQPWAPFVF